MSRPNFYSDGSTPRKRDSQHRIEQKILGATIDGSSSGGGAGVPPPPAGADTQVQFNDAGVLGADSGLTFDKNTQTVQVSSDLNVGNELTVNSATNIGGGLGVTGNIGLTGELVLPDNIRVTFNPGATNAGLNVGAVAGNPSAPSDGDLWYDSTGTQLKARINGATVALGAGGGSGSPGGSDTQVQFNDSSSFGGDSGLTFNKTSNVLTAGGIFTQDLTVSSSNAPTISVAQSLTAADESNCLALALTWNTSGAPTAIKLEVNDDASDAASLLLDLQLDGASKFAVDKSGNVTAAGALNLSNDSGAGSPEGAVVGYPGNTYLNTTDDSFWVKKTGSKTNTGWIQLLG